MGLINNDKLYPKDKRITINDEVIGSDKDNNGVTRNYPMSNIVSLINEVNDLKFSLYIYSNDDANVRKGVFNINGVNFTFSNLDQESNDNTALFNVIKNSKENIIIIIKDGAQTFGYYHVKNVITNTESSTFELELINNIKAGNYVLENDYVFNINITTSTLTQIQSDWNESNSVQSSFIKNKPTLFSGDYNDLTNKPTPTTGQTNVQSNWNQTDDTKDDFIKNKPAAFTSNFYDEGDFTPTIGSTPLDGVYTSNVVMARYVRCGNSVSFVLRIDNINTTKAPTNLNSRIEVVMTGAPVLDYSSTFVVGPFIGSNKTFNALYTYISSAGRIGFLADKTASGDNYTALKTVTMNNGTIHLAGTYITNIYTP